MKKETTPPLIDVDVSNVYIYIGDAVRWDYLPQRLRDSGLTVKTVASSIHSPTSFASIFSGRYLPQHQIEDFDDQLSVDSPHLFRSAPNEFHTGFANTINEMFVTSESSIIDKTLRVDKVSQSLLGNIESPFIFVERGPGGHAPYGDHNLTASEYFKQNIYQFSEGYETDYQKSIKKDVNHFLEQLKKLNNRQMAEDTLVIYMSDHGELLGEHGTVGHNSLIHPSLVYVPTVFFHPSIEGNHYVESGIFRHIDLLPTVFRALNLDVPSGTLGRSIIKKSLASRGSTFYSTNSTILGRKFSSKFTSMWDYDGGYVFRESSLPGSVLNLLSHYKGVKGGYMRKKPHKNIPFFISKEEIYSNPQFSKQQAKELLQQCKNIVSEGEETADIDVDKHVLRDLGYLE